MSTGRTPASKSVSNAACPPSSLPAGAILPPQLLPHYLAGGQQGQQELRDDAATFMRTWLRKRVLQCISYVNNPDRRM